MQDFRVVAGALDSSSLHRALQPAVRDEVATIDLGHASFVTPAGLVAVASFAQRAARKGRQVEVLRPTNSDVANYVSRARLGTVLDEVGANHDLPSVREHDVGDNLIPVESFDTADGVETLARHVWTQVDPIDPDAAAVIYTALAAMGENVGYHSGQSRGYMAAQKTHRGRVLRFAVADAGRGFRKSLSHRSPKSDAAALAMALQAGVSGTDDAARGYGLHEMVQRFRGINATLHLRSGSGSHTVFATGRTRSDTYSIKLRGSVLEGSIPLTRKK